MIHGFNRHRGRGKKTIVMTLIAETSQRQNLREQVERLLPAWQSWYPSLFHAAEDLGLIRARVCSPSSLMLSNRHASIQNEAMQAFREQWCVEDEPDMPEHSLLLKRIQNEAKKGGKKK
jgi:hypothetical protein